MEVWLVRHAEDRAVAEGRFGDSSLSPRGREQARALGRALRTLPVAVCLCSPLVRARETAEIALEKRDVELVIEPCLAEGEIGELGGLDHAAARERFPLDLRFGPTLIPRLRASGRTAPGGETREAFLARADSARQLVESRLGLAGAPALVISHGGLLNYLLQGMVAPPPRDEVRFRFEHCGVARLLRHSEEPAFGPFSALCFGPPGVEPN